MGRQALAAFVHSQSGSEMAQENGILAGKRGLIMGLANNRSIAWGIAKAARAAGAELAAVFTQEEL